MSNRPLTDFNTTTFQGRRHVAPSATTSKPVLISDFKMVAPQPFALPAHPKQQQSQVLHRQAVRSPMAQATPLSTSQPRLQSYITPPLPPLPLIRKPQLVVHKRNIPKRLTLGALAAIALLTIAFAGMWLLSAGHPSSSPVVSQLPATEVTPAPDSRPLETKPTAAIMGAYQVAPDAPRQIIIPKLYAYSRIQPIGLNAHNQLQAPGNIYDSGWYTASAKPGAINGPSTMLIDGHQEGPSQPGIFAGLNKLIVGDSIQIIRGDGKKLNYSVVKTQTMPSVNLSLSQLMLPAMSGKTSINLVTVTGQYDKPSVGNLSTVVSAVQTDLTTN